MVTAFYAQNICIMNHFWILFHNYELTFIVDMHTQFRANSNLIAKQLIQFTTIWKKNVC